MLKKILFSLICALMGAVFIFSAYIKLYPIEPFELTFVDLGIGNWQMAPFIARILIATEFLIGFALLLNLLLRKVTYKLSIGILVFFCMYLVLQLIFQGNKGNCGCFGTAIAMTPMQALIKNIIMLAILGVLYKFHEGWNMGKFSKYLFIVCFLAAAALPFILNPVELDYSKAYLNKPEDNYKLELDSLYNNAKLNVPPKTLSEGKHIIAFMSLTCPHCRIAAKKIRIMHERNPEISFYFVLNGDDEKLKPFFDDTHTDGIPHCMLLGRPFVYLAGTSMPAIYLVNNGMVEHDVNYIDLDQGEIEEWMKK
ncbi:MAG: hypothetical protein JWO44_2296 [Bacteroidetes bacterium]|jgi:hypothetical protein|nr:hypothetical protein [Bacteroidota bacterium]